MARTQKNKKTMETTRNQLIMFIFIASAAAGLILSTENKKLERVETAQAVEKQKIQKEYFKEIKVEAKSAYVLDINENKVLYEQNSDQQLPLASLTKIMTAIVAQEKNDSGGDRKMNDDQLSGLMTAMLVESSNEAASTIAQTINGKQSTDLVALMNKKAQELGLAKTFFSNPTGLDTSSTTAGAYGSAEEVSKMLTYGFQQYPQIFDQTKYAEVEVDSKIIKNKNELVGKRPYIVAGKTGLTSLAGGNLAMIISPGNGKFFATVVMGSSEKGRFADSEQLIDEILRYYTNI